MDFSNDTVVMGEEAVPNLEMDHFNTTSMGVLKGVADFLGATMSDAWLFGGSAYAFLISHGCVALQELIERSWNRE